MLTIRGFHVQGLQMKNSQRVLPRSVGREGTTRQGNNFNTFNAFHEQGYTQPLSINKTKQWRKQRALYRQAKHLKGKIGVQSTVTN